jgi:TP901 family phage tail tape measure protein
MSDRQRITEKRRAEREATREAINAMREVKRTRRRMFAEQHRLEREDLQARRTHIARLKKLEADLRDKRSSAKYIVGTGVGGSLLTGVGLSKAGNLESAMLALKQTFQELGQDGAVDVAKLNDQLARAETLGVRLGNDLQGSTKDYIEIFSALKAAGLDVETILGGAGKATAYLANVSGAMTDGRFRELAEEVGMFGKMFQLKPEDFEKQVNLFSALKDRFNIDSSHLIESSKYFLPTASALGLKGLSGASKTSKLFAALKRHGGLEGSQAGTSATSLFSHYISHPRKVKELKKETGIDIDFFDSKGGFMGMENAFAQMEKLRKLSNEKRAEVLMEIFGEQGNKAATAMVEAGAEGWRNITAEANKAVPVQEKILQQMDTFNAKVEALTGSFENFVATSFKPLAESLKPGIDSLNSFLGTATEFAKTHPEIAKVATGLFAAGSAALVVGGSIRFATTSVKLWSAATKIARAETALLGDHARSTGRQIGFMADQAASKTATSRWRGAGATIGKAMAGGIALSIAGIAIEGIIGSLIDRAQQEVDRRKAKAEGDDLKKERSDLYAQLAIPGAVDPVEANKRINEINKLLGENAVTGMGATRSIDSLGEWNRVFSNPSQFASSIALLSGSPARSQSRVEWLFEHLAGLGTGGKFAKDAARTMMAEDVAKAELKNAAFDSAEALKAWMDSIIKTGAYNEQEIAIIQRLASEVYPNFASAINDASTAVQNFKATLQPSDGKPALPKLPGMASGGIVTRPTPTWIGEKGPEAVIPLNRLMEAVNPRTGASTPGIEPYARMGYAGAGSGRVARAGNKSLVVHYAPVVHLPPGADHSQVEVFRRMMHAHSRELFEIINRQINLEFRDRLMGY